MKDRTKGLLCALGCIISYMVVGCAYALVVLFIDPVCSRIGCSATEFSFTFTAIGLGMLIGGLFIGKLFDKFHPKFIGIFGGLGILVLYASMAFSPSVIVIWVAAFIFGLLYGMCGATLLNIMLASWFNRGRGTLLGVANMAGNAIVIVTPPIVASMVNSIGMEGTAIGLGIGMTGIIVLACLFLVCQRPSAYGASPIDLGKEKKNEETVQSNNTQESLSLEMPVSKMAVTPAFIMSMICIVVVVMANSMYYNNSMTIYQGLGLDYQGASYAVSIASFAALVMVTLFGWLCDKIGTKVTLIAYCGIAGLVLLCTPMLSGWTGAIVLAVLISCGQCGNMYAALVLPGLFGNEKSSVLLSWAGMASGLGSMIAAPFANAIAQSSGSFNTALLVAGVFFLVSIPMTIIILSAKTAASIKAKDMAYRNANK